MPEHARGPLTYRDTGLWLVILDADARPVAKVYKDPETGEANARLWCAAPDLLAACEAAAVLLHTLSPTGSLCRAAIAKARGEAADAQA